MTMVIILMLSLKKHDEYIREFNGIGKEFYPINRRAIIPYIL